MTNMTAADFKARLDRVLPPPRNAEVPYESVLRERVQACRTDPVARLAWDEAAMLDYLSGELESQERWDEAIEVAREAMAAGLPIRSDERCRIAQLLMRSSRMEQAAALWAEVQAEMPDNPWVYLEAGLEYLEIDNFREALRWLTPGLDLALDIGNRHGLISDLAQAREQCLPYIGIDTDDLQEAAQIILDQLLIPPNAPTRAEPSTRPHRKAPAGELAAAMAFVDALAETAQTDDLAPINNPQLRAWRAGRGLGAGASATRAAYAAELAHTTAPGSVSRPPGRNARCWCGSGRKYKHCCGSVAT